MVIWARIFPGIYQLDWQFLSHVLNCERKRDWMINHNLSLPWFVWYLYISLSDKPKLMRFGTIQQINNRYTDLDLQNSSSNNKDTGAQWNPFGLMSLTNPFIEFSYKIRLIHISCMKVIVSKWFSKTETVLLFLFLRFYSEMHLTVTQVCY